MARQLDRILVIDLESTAWEGSPPAGEESEIIEVGLCLLEVSSCERVDRQSWLVRPERSRVSEFCTRLTTLTQEQVDGGISFADVCSILRTQYRSRDRLWASYGDYDRRQFERQCGAFGVGYPFGPTHLNVKNLFAVARALPHEVGMAEALAMLGLPLEGTHHRGGDDAWNIARILGILIQGARIHLSHSSSGEGVAYEA
ncbi:MAG TPA: 3'-5' exonuclease [Isosphaeraceae bacterium]|jgi:inhibitor of KinA sporulation pathway (predicted exonuclease)|nr:3'-5' exonuclease [Isosphaeraceae bacterium]